MITTLHLHRCWYFKAHRQIQRRGRSLSSCAMAFHFRHARPNAGRHSACRVRSSSRAGLENILSALQKGGMGPSTCQNRSISLRTEDLPAYAAIRSRFLGDCRPASMLLVAAALPKSGFLIEIEAIAAAPA